jgi:cytochrome P450
MLRLDFRSQEYLQDPTGGLAKLRAAGPVVAVRFPIVGKTWITTNADLAARVLKDNETFTMRKNGKVAGVRWWMPGSIRSLAVSMLSMDEPDHTRLRSIVDEAFRRRTVLDMEPRVFAIADELAAELFTDGTPADLVERYARRLPLLVICELLGLPRADRPRFIAWANNLTRLTGMASFLRLLAGIGPMRRYLEGRLQAARETGGEGLIAELVRVEREGGRISNQEMVAMVFLLLGAGSETTAHLISGSVYELLKAPKWRDWLEEDWSRATLAVEEFLRFVSPVQFTKPRVVRRDVELGGVRLKKGNASWRCWRRPIWILKPIRIPRLSILRGGPIGTCHSAPGSTSAWGTSLRAWRAGARWRRFSSDGRSSNSPFRQSQSVGGSGLVSGRSKCFRSQRRPASMELLSRPSPAGAKRAYESGSARVTGGQLFAS